jgi:hypothetical protein
MLTAVAILASLVLIGWLIYRALRGRQIRAHTVAYGLACIAGIFTFAFFLDMAILRLFKVFASILLGAALIVLAAYLQRRRQPAKSSGDTGQK